MSADLYDRMLSWSTEVADAVVDGRDPQHAIQRYAQLRAEWRASVGLPPVSVRGSVDAGPSLLGRKQP